ncbi:MAG: proton-conducting transporter membrane subunit [Thermoplasmataceae archaeon]|jgi:hydrogenase-4 component B|nr:MAG: hydrogenase 4 subunit B [Thermoplasmatales archaeon E-plasma]
MIPEIILGVLCIPPIAAIFSRKVSYVTNSIISSLIIILSLLMLLSVIKSSSFSMGYLSFSIDKLSAVFLFILGLVVLLDSIFSLYYVNTNRIIAFAYSLSIYSMMGVLISSNYLTLILFWEGMSIFGYLAIAYRKSSQAFPPFVFLAFGELSTLFLAVSFAGIYFYTGTLNMISMNVNPYILFIALVGFMIKMGIIPLQMVEWLPIAHGEAPTNGSIIFSAAMTTVAIYATLRLVMLQSVPYISIGITLMIVGSFSLLMASIYAVSSENSKMLPAYSTIENCGAMLTLTGLFIINMYYGNVDLAGFIVIAVLVYAMAHALAKTTMFISTAVSENKNFSDINGGSIRGFSRFAFAVSAISLTGLIPLGGGIGEWMLLESLFITSTGPQTYISLTAIFAGSLAALGAGMSIIAFTKYFSFMTRNRENIKRSSDVRTPLSIAGPAVLIMGVIAPVIITVFSPVIANFTKIENIQILGTLKDIPQGFLITSPGVNGYFGFISPTFDILFISVPFVVTYYMLRGKDRGVNPWNGGLPVSDKFSSFAYSNSIRLIMKKVYFTREEKINGIYSERTFDIFWVVISDLASIYTKFSRYFARKFMNGNINAYMAYTIIALLLSLISLLFFL